MSLAVVPFALMLAAVAVGPLWVPRWWEANRHKLLVSCALAAPVSGLYLVRRPHALLKALLFV